MRGTPAEHDEDFAAVRRARRRAIFALGVPAAALLQVVVPVVHALLLAPQRGILCTASVHGARAVRCGLTQLVGEWIDAALFMNYILLGLPLLIAYVVSVVVALVGESVYTRLRNR